MVDFSYVHLEETPSPLLVNGYSILVHHVTRTSDTIFWNRFESEYGFHHLFILEEISSHYWLMVTQFPIHLRFLPEMTPSSPLTPSSLVPPPLSILHPPSLSPDIQHHNPKICYSLWQRLSICKFKIHKSIKGNERLGSLRSSNLEIEHVVIMMAISKWLKKKSI